MNNGLPRHVRVSLIALLSQMATLSRLNKAERPVMRFDRLRRRVGRSILLTGFGIATLGLTGCVNVGIGFDKYPDGSPVPGAENYDSDFVEITDQYVGASWTGLKPELDIRPPQNAALVPVISADAPSQPNVLCLVQFEGYTGGATVITLEMGTRVIWLTVTSGEPTIELMGFSGQTIASRTVGAGRHEFRADRRLSSNPNFREIRISGSGSERDLYCIDDIEWQRRGL